MSDLSDPDGMRPSEPAVAVAQKHTPMMAHYLRMTFKGALMLEIA